MAKNVNQREVYLLPFPFKEEEVIPHLFIVLSCLDANRLEDTFLAVMITSSDQYYDDYSFDLTDEMFDQPLAKENSHVRMHLILLSKNQYIKGDTGKSVNKMKKKYFDRLMQSIGDMVFNYDFQPL